MMYLDSHRAMDQSARISPVRPTVEAYWIEMRIGPDSIMIGFGPLESIINDPSSATLPDSYSHSSVTTPLAAYVNHETGEPIQVKGRNRREREVAQQLAQAYWRDVKSVEESILGTAIKEETTGYTPLEIIASGVNELEQHWPGAAQTTTFLGNGQGYYTRDATHYRQKLASLAALHGVTTDIVHKWINAHEVTHAQGVTDERETHESTYRALEKAIERSEDPAERRDYELMLHVQARELARRYGVHKKPRTPQKRVLN